MLWILSWFVLASYVYCPVWIALHVYLDLPMNHTQQNITLLFSAFNEMIDETTGYSQSHKRHNLEKSRLAEIQCHCHFKESQGCILRRPGLIWFSLCINEQVLRVIIALRRCVYEKSVEFNTRNCFYLRWRKCLVFASNCVLCGF